MAESPKSPESIGTAPTEESTPNDDLGSAASLLRGIANAPGLRGEGPLHDGQVIGGKYEIEGAIGEGGMGVVYRAVDRQLGREVAIKIGSAVSANALARMEREAQALARLSHPNVVGVYEVGEVGGRVFVAMEHVGGGTLADWLAAERRSVRAILAMVCAAGDGLAAAHAAGIVHRDVKPANVLVGEDGRPRVADFGLARDALASAPEIVEADDEPAPLREVTRFGAIVGTPAYMAPEQLAGAEVDARADQFSFCATLWEALYGLRPFPGTTPQAVKHALATTSPRTGDVVRAGLVPRHVEAALRRGLSADPGARWPVVAALLVALRRDPARTRRNVLIAGGVAAAVGAAIVLPIVLTPSVSPCADDEEALAPVWNAERASSLAADVRPRVDSFARTWIAGHHAACVATRVDGAQSETMLERRNVCLAAMSAELAATLASIERGAPPAPVLATLPELGRCADVATLAKQPELPAGGRAAIEAAYRDVAVARVAALEPDAPDPIAAGDRVLATARATTWPPVIAYASRIRAEILFPRHAEAGRAALQEASSIALAAGADHDAGWAMAELAHQLAIAGDRDSARSWLALARSLWERTARDPQLAAELQLTATMLDR